MDKSKLALGIALVAVLLGGSAWLRGPREKVIEKTEVRTGAISSPDIQSPYISVGGQGIWASRSASLPTSSTTLCALAAPSTASSTLIKAGLRVDTATATAATLTIHKSASRWVKTTLLAQDALAASNVGALLATSTANDTVFQSGDYLVFGMSQTYESVTPAGACFAVWSQL